MNHGKRNRNQKSKEATKKYKTTKKKKVDVEEIIKKKVFKVGADLTELRQQFENFSNRYINLKISTNKTYDKNRAIQYICNKIPITYKGHFIYHGLSIAQMQSKVRKMKQMLDKLRTKRENLLYSDKQ